MSSLAVNAITDASGGTTASINGYTPTASNMAGKNRIINGAMMIDQRNAGASVTINSASDVYTLDRFSAVGQSADGVFTVARSSVAPSGFTNSLLVTVTTADSSVGASQFYDVNQFIEGFNVADFGWGAASAATVTLSFWVRSSVTGTFGGALRNASFNRSYPFSYTISAANTWEQKSVTIAGDTTGTWGTTNGIGIGVTWSLGDGSSRLSAAGAWAAGNFAGATGQTNLISTSGATFYLTGVQLEVGSTATEFEHRLYPQELALCERYGQQVAFNIYIGNGSGYYWSTGINFNSMRTAPTFSSLSGGSTGNISVEVVETIAPQGCRYTILASSSNAYAYGRTAFASAEL